MTSMGFVLPRLVDQDLFYQCVQQLCSQLGGLAAFLDFPSNKAPTNFLPQKVKKKTVFLSKTVFFVVAGEGFEPTTSGL